MKFNFLFNNFILTKKMCILLKNDEKYLIIQFGMCLFKRIENSDKPNRYIILCFDLYYN